jgi:hypothetical protein
MSLRIAFDRMRAWIRRMQHNSVTQETLESTHVLEALKHFLGDENRAMVEAKEVPQEIVEDLTFFQRKWEFGDLSILPLRGLILGGPTGLLPDPEWPFLRSADFYGPGHLVNGQVFWCRAAMMRDGAHAPPIAGICGTVEAGAKSIVMGRHEVSIKDYYADIDEQETIWYYGTALARKPGDDQPTNILDPDRDTYRRSRITKTVKGEGPTDATLALIKSYQTGNDVRVFRSWRLAEIVPNRPLRGFRYDGLYVVKDYSLQRRDRQIYRFRMERKTSGQGPLREANPPLMPGARRARKRKRNEEDDDNDEDVQNGEADE